MSGIITSLMAMIGGIGLYIGFWTLLGMIEYKLTYVEDEFGNFTGGMGHTIFFGMIVAPWALIGYWFFEKYW